MRFSHNCLHFFLPPYTQGEIKHMDVAGIKPVKQAPQADPLFITPWHGLWGFI